MADEEKETAEEKKYEDPHALTDLSGPRSDDSPVAFLQRKKTLMIIAVALSVTVGGAMLFNVFSESKKKAEEEDARARAARTPSDFLDRQMARAASGRTEPGGADAGVTGEPGTAGNPEAGPSGPGGAGRGGPAYQAAAASPRAPDRLERPVPVDLSRPPGEPDSACRAGAGSSSGAGAGRGAGQPDPLLAAYYSPLVPGNIAGSVFSGGSSQSRPAVSGYPGDPAAGSRYAEMYPYMTGQGQPGLSDYYAALAASGAARPSLPGSADPYAAQNDQAGKQAFGGSGVSAGAGSGSYIPDGSVWTGTIIPGILLTGINTDLPGNILARVTDNVYDSRTGKLLLIPQGTVLVARYNSSISYAQSRVQIAWDILIRPDGYQVELDGAAGVDRKGFAGIAAEYSENWFEYLKAAGLISLFSVANAKMTAETAEYATDETAAAMAQSNAEFVNEMGGNIVNRALNVQPTLTVDSGTTVNIMTNKNLFFPPVPDYPVSGPYRLE